MFPSMPFPTLPWMPPQERKPNSPAGKGAGEGGREIRFMIFEREHKFKEYSRGLYVLLRSLNASCMSPK